MLITVSDAMQHGSETLLAIELPGLKKLRSGKVREMFDLGAHLLMVATDRISAFDCVIPNGIPEKGRILTQISEFWFERTRHIVANHRCGVEPRVLPTSIAPYAGKLAGRSLVVRKANPFPVECVVRGFLAGSGWNEYRRTGSVCGIALPSGLGESDPLPEPIFTPATKAQDGHDQNIPFSRMEALLGTRVAGALRDYSLALYAFARDFARERGVVIADTKFEFGAENGEILLIDEALTPDSSRFWPAEGYQPRRPRVSFDKQGVRDYLARIDWDKTPPAPPLPEEVVETTRARYREVLERLTGHA